MTFTFPTCPLPPNSTVWAYLRDSGGPGQDQSSQRAYLLAYCKHHQLHIDRLFEDSSSGGTTDGRIEFEAMIDLARASKTPTVDGIIYWDIKRFARNQLDSQYYKADLRKRGYKLISLSDNIPQDENISGVFESILEWKAEQDRKDLKKDVLRGMEYMVSLKDDDGNYIGLAPANPPVCYTTEPYDTGLKRNDGRPRIVQRWIPDPETWEQGKLAWQMRTERASYREIENETNLFQDKRYPGTYYYRFFRNKIYLGHYQFKEKIFENFVPALITPDQWEMVQEYNYSRPQRGKIWPTGKKHPKAGQTTYLLSGLCRCGYCDSKIHGVKINQYRYYACSSRVTHQPCQAKYKYIRREKIEGLIIETTLTNILTPEFITDLTKQVNLILTTDTTAQQLTHLNRQIREINQKIQNLTDQIEIYPSENLIERIRQREVELKQKITEKKKLETRPKLEVTEEQLEKHLYNYREKLKTGNFRAQQKILSTVIDHIDLKENQAIIHYGFPMLSYIKAFSVYSHCVKFLSTNTKITIHY